MIAGNYCKYWVTNFEVNENLETWDKKSNRKIACCKLKNYFFIRFMSSIGKGQYNEKFAFDAYIFLLGNIESGFFYQSLMIFGRLILSKIIIILLNTLANN